MIQTCVVHVIRNAMRFVSYKDRRKIASSMRADRPNSEAPTLDEDAGMPKEQSPGKPTTRRYSPEEKAAAVRMVRALRAELGTEQGTVQRVARQLGYGVESVRMWVRQADIDEGLAPGVSTAESARVKELEQENRELKRANVILGEFTRLAA